ncbi:hypothetical protein VP01_574g6 [Puccinia sorghi]|uniref:OTU domain-containing protein n=1 Tax=Puccinia sorghi TaxID=27349 RepID=A0A0L6UIG1_9BASI|nr:hypothetical protein VP01_574g6 [Puccinia sorghi]
MWFFILSKFFFVWGGDQYLMGCLILGHLNNVMSRSMYEHLWSILSASSLLLPCWSTIRRQRYNLWSMLNFEIRENESVLCNKAFTLSLENIIGSELANPYVDNHLELYSHDPRGKNIYALYQSQKWREELDPEHRVQMVAYEGKHFYIFEPVGLSTTKTLFAKCIAPRYAPMIGTTEHSGEFEVQIPGNINFNSKYLIKKLVSHFGKIYSEIRTFRGDLYVQKCFHSLIIWAQVKIICHVPITLYEDDTSGNTSKQWNKHVPYCMTMRPLELAEAIVEELNELATLGCVAHDFSLKEDVLLMTIPPCFLADSPMASKNLSLKMFSRHCKIPEPRSWTTTIQLTKELWTSSQTEKKTEFDKKQKLYGLRDRINFEIMGLKNKRYDERCRIMEIESKHEDRIYNPFLKLKEFDGCKDTPVEILHVILLAQLIQLQARWRAFNTDGLKILPIQPKYMVAHYNSFVGKEFRIVFQAAPFVYFPFMNNEQKDIWKSMCHLSRLALLTHIYDMEEHKTNMKINMKNFLYHVCLMTGKWANKQKFYMLLHLPDSTRRFGTASLFATEKFEIYNGIIRTSSVHSNCLSPGRDLAISFSNYQVLRFLVSVQSVFQDTPLVQRSLGYNSIILQHGQRYPSIYGRSPKHDPKQEIPLVLKIKYPNSNIKKLVSIKLSTKEVLREGIFSLESNSSKQGGKIVFVESIWETSPWKYYVRVNHCQKTEHFILFKCTAQFLVWWHEVLFNAQVQPIFSESMSDEVQKGLKVWQKSKDKKTQEGFIPNYSHIAPSTTAMPASHIPTQIIIPSLHNTHHPSKTHQVLKDCTTQLCKPSPVLQSKLVKSQTNIKSTPIQIENQPCKSHSNEPQEINEPPHNPDLQVDLPEDVTNFVDKIYDVKGDGHCGYRAADLCLGRGQDAYMEIIRELYEEIEKKKALYIKQGTFNNLPLTLKSILTQTSGPIGRRVQLLKKRLGKQETQSIFCQ